MTKRNGIFALATTSLLAGIILAAKLTAGPPAEPARPSAGPSGYHILKTIPVGGEGFWDYASTDSAGRRVYISHGTHVVVLDADTQEKVGDIPDTQGVHGIAIAPESGHGFVSNGRTNNITMFDLKTLKTLSMIPAGTNPDAIIYDPATKRVFAMNGRSGTATAVDVATGMVVGTIQIGGKLEFAVADGKGHVYVNVENKSEEVELDSKNMTVLAHWPLDPTQPRPKISS